MKSMNDPKPASCYQFSESFYGTSTVGERGQIVIPAEARTDMGFLPGDKLLIMRHPIHQGLMLFKLDAAREFLDDYRSNLEKIAQQETTE